MPNPTLKPKPMRSDERSSGLGSGSAAPAWNRRLVIAQDGVAESGALFTRVGWRGETKAAVSLFRRMCSVVRVHVISIPHVWQCTQKNAFWQIPKQGIMKLDNEQLGSGSNHFRSQRVIHQACDAVHPTRTEFRVDLPTRRTHVAMPSFVQRPGRQSRGQERQGRRGLRRPGQVEQRRRGEDARPRRRAHRGMGGRRGQDVAIPRRGVEARR